MFNVSYQVSRHRRAQGALLAVALIAASLIASGCAPMDQRPASRAIVVPFPTAEALPRIEVYGELIGRLPAYDATPALDRFLYGPSDYGKTSLRNAQGMAMLDQRLMVCDQGQANLIAIDLTTGRSVPFCDRNEPPRCPVDVVVADGRVYVADTTLRRVLVYDLNGSLFDTLAPAAGDAFRPGALLVHDGVLYAGDFGQRRVERYALAGRTWLEPLTPPMDQPSMVAPAGLAVTGEGTLLIADAVRGTVYRIARDGTWLTPIGRPGRLDGELVRPKQLAVTPGGLILVADAGRQSVVVFDAQGQFFTEIFGTSTAWSGFTLPTGLLVCPPNAHPLLRDAVGDERTARASAFVLVSDPLHGRSVTVLGVVEAPGADGAKGGGDAP